MTQSKIIIYCDGGLGNRLNALLSGLAIVRHFNIDYTLHWPINRWCSAAFSDIFAGDYSISTESLIQLKGHLNDHAMLLHDSIASEALDVAFSSAYRYGSLNDFGEKEVATDKLIFFYPALIPQWIPQHLIHAEMANLAFTPYITSEVEDFIQNTIGKPFHGLHLRRTDLNIGLTDLEVFKIAQNNPDHVFFVSSDDPQAERLAAGHPNVFSRIKASYVQKTQEADDWLALSKDEDGRTYHGNIQRDKASVIDGAIDMLILAHSQIVGFSGSTFQTMARNLGEHWTKLEWPRPKALDVFPMREIQRQVEHGHISTESLIQIANIWLLDPANKLPTNLLHRMLDVLRGEDLLQLLYAMAQFAARDENYRLADIYLSEILRQSPGRIDPAKMKIQILRKLGDMAQATEIEQLLMKSVRV